MLAKEFDRLPRPSSSGSYAVDASQARVRVGKSFEGYAAILVGFDTRNGTHAHRRLVNLEYRPPSQVDVVRQSGSKAAAELAILVCKDADPKLVRYFFRVVEAVLWREAEGGDEERFEAALDSVITLFRAMGRPGTRAIQGLWAELATIVWAARPETAVTSWHSGARALHDFAAGSMRLEVKSTSQALREHTFVLDQLTANQAGETVVASVMVVESDVGASVHDLVDRIQGRLRNDRETLRRIEEIIADCLGEGWRDADELRFDLELARDTLLLYSARDVPTIPQPLPPSIKAVHFTVDLPTTPRLNVAVARSIGAFFAEILPVD